MLIVQLEKEQPLEHLWCRKRTAAEAPTETHMCGAPLVLLTCSLAGLPTMDCRTTACLLMLTVVCGLCTSPLGPRPMGCMAAATEAPTPALASRATAAGACILPGVDGCAATNTHPSLVPTNTAFIVDIINNQVRILADPQLSTPAARQRDVPVIWVNPMTARQL